MNKKSLWLGLAFLLFYFQLSFAQEAAQLDEVKIVASRTVSDAEGYTTNLRGLDIVKGKSAAELLGFLPNVSCENGNFKINGLDVSEIYVDGVKLSDVSELGNISGNMVDKVQVKYLAGTDQNANLSGGMIMITLRQPSEGGYYGSVKAATEWNRSSGFGNGRIGLLVYYRYKNLSIYDNVEVGYQKIKENSEQWQVGTGLNAFLTETTKSENIKFRNRLSFVQQLGNNTKLGGNYLFATSRPRPISTIFAEDTWSSVHNKMNTVVQEGTLQFSTLLGKKGLTMGTTVDYYNRNCDNDHRYNIDNSDIAKTEEKENLNLWKFKVDFLYPRSRKLSWKFGVSMQAISSSYTPNLLVENGRFSSSSSSTKTAGFTPIAYAEAKGILWKFRYSAGVNWQLNRIRYEDLNAGVKNHNTQWAFNPMLQLMMPFGAKMNHALMLNYKHTLNDIPYSAISSVVTWSDAYNYSVGNPDLVAQSADMLMAGLSLFRNKLNFTAVYARSHNQIYWQTFEEAENSNVVYTKPINIPGQSLWGIGTEWMESPLKWWQFKLAGRVEITPENAVIGGVKYDKTRFKEYFYFNNNFNFSSGWGGMLNANLEPTFRTFDRTYHAVFNVDGRIYKNFLKNNLQVAIDFTAFGNRRKLDRQVGSNTITYKYTTPVQYVGLNVVWSFSGGKKVNVDVVDGIQDFYEIKDNR